jgi:hypothetical protein
MKAKLKEQKGTTMVLVVCLFLLFCVLGISLLNAANANVTNSTLELEKEQTMILAGSIYDVVNELIEDGALTDAATGALMGEMDVSGFKDGNDRNIRVKVETDGLGGIVTVLVNITFEGSGEELCVKSTYESAGGGKYRLRNCYGVVDSSEDTP